MKSKFTRSVVKLLLRRRTAEFTRRTSKANRLALGLGLAMTGTAHTAFAASSTWTGNGADTNWGTTLNWSSGVPGAVGTTTNTDIATFAGTTAVTAVTLEQVYNIGGITFGNAAAAGSSYTIGANAGNGLLLSSGGTIKNNALTPASALVNTYTVAAPVTLQNSSGTATGSGIYTFDASGGSTSATQNSFLQFSGTVSGAASTGNTTTLTLTGNNNIRALNTSVINALSGVIGDGANGGNLKLAFTTPIGNNSTTWLVSGANTYSGGTTLTRAGTSTGTLRIANNTALGTGTITFNGLANLQMAVGSNLSLTNAVNFAAATGNIDTNGGAMSIGGVVSGVGTWTKASTGTLTLSGANTYTGSTTISAGTLAGIGANAFGSTSGISIAAAGTLSLRGDTSTSFVKASDSSSYAVTTSASGATINADQATVAGTAAKTMTLGSIGTSSTAAAYQLNFTGANNTSLSIGAVTGAASTAAGTVTLANAIPAGAGLLTLASYTSANTTGGETVIFNGVGNTTVSGAITPSATALALTYSGTGTLSLNGADTYTGLTTINSGAVKLGSLSALGTGGVTLATGGTLDVNGNAITNPFTSNATRGTLTNTGAAVDLSPTSLTNNGSFTINGTGGITLGTVTGTGGNALVKNGTNTLTMAGTADNAFLAGTVNTGMVVLNKASAAGVHAFNTLTVTGGTVQYGANQVTGGTLGGQINGLTINGGTVDLNGNSGKNTTVTNFSGTSGVITNTSATAATLTVGANNVGGSYAGAIQNGAGSVALTKIGTGTTILSGTDTYSGTTTVSAGTLALNAAGADGIGALAVAGTVTTGVTGAVGGGAVTLTNGTLQNTFLASGGTANNVQTSSNLSLGAGNSVATIDFGAGNTGAKFVFTLADASTFNGILNIINYTGNPFDPSTLEAASGGGLDQLFFAPGVEQQLTNVFFINPSGNTGTFQGRLLSSGEVVAPEPSQWLALGLGALGLGGLALRARRRSGASIAA